MRREDPAKDLMPIRLYNLLWDLHDHWERWRPKVGFPTKAVGLTSGGVVSSTCEDLEDEADHYAIRVIDAAWDQLGPSQRVSVEIAMGWLPLVATVREGVLEGAIEALEAKCRAGGVSL